MFRSLFVLAVAALLAAEARASDHADPVDPLRLGSSDDRGLTGLFAFPYSADGKRVNGANEGDGLVLILCVNRSLTAPPPYKGLDAYRFTIFIDTRSEVRISYPADVTKPASPGERDTARYGGVVVNPEGIGPTFAISVKLKNDLGREFREENVLDWSVSVDRGDGLKPVDPKEAGKLVTKREAGVRDDPFIFPPFFGTNVIAMAVKVPYASLPARDRPLVLWATAERNGSQIDHVGRSQRTQLPRFDFLNTLPPREHVAAIRKMRDDPTLRQDVLRYLFPTEFAFRPFDDRPDVMIFTRNHPAGYPNGRRLQDDIAKLACEQGDCQLYELTFAKPRSPESERHARYEGGRPTANDKPFLDEWPYLADPWPDSDPVPMPGLTTKNKIYLGGMLLAGAAVSLLPWGLYFRAKRQLRLARQILPPAAVVPAVAVPPAPGGQSP